MRISTSSVVLFIFSLAFTAQGQYSSSSTKSFKDKIVFNRGGIGSSFNVEMRGKIELTDDDKDIKSMSPDGYLEINKTTFGSKRSLIISSNGSTLKREYYEGRTKVEYEPEGRKWLAEVLPELVRSTTIGAESRVDRFYRKGGASAVVSEIGQLESDYVKSHYANLLMKLSNVPGEYPMIIRGVTQSIESDYYNANFLQENAAKFLKDKAATEAVFEASSRIDSDHYKTEVIKAALKSQPASLASIKVILQAADRMDSDHYKTEVLTTLLKQDNLSDDIMSEMISATRFIDSDYYRSVVLNKALDKPGLSPTSFQRALESVRDIDSDHYKTEVLKRLIDGKLSTDLDITLLTISNSIESDYYVSLVLNEMLEKQNLNDDAFERLVERAGQIDSDHYAMTVLQEALQSADMNDARLISVLKATADIESDHYITEVLVAAAPKVKNADATVKDAYRNTAKRIESETYYGRAMRAIERD